MGSIETTRRGAASMLEDLKRAVWRYADAHANADGVAIPPMPGMGMMRAYAPTPMMKSMYRPVLCLVLQGAKQMTVGGEALEFSAGRSVLVSIDKPTVGRVVQARRDAPYLALAIALDMGIMREVMGELAATPSPAPRREAALFVDDIDEAISDCALRLMRLLDRPEAIPVLRPAILKEMHYWLLTGRHGNAIRRLAMPDSHAQRIARAVAILRAEFVHALPVERLAAAAGMSPSSFHQHFKAATSLSPLQFQKQLRLLEARRLMLSEGLSASQAGFEVGYESVSQFTREYARLFGAPPRRDVSENRAA
jgi:AraC-like DNA-binding protein